MTLEALLTFFGILVAVLAVVRPVQRQSLRLFVPMSKPCGLRAALEAKIASENQQVTDATLVRV